MLISISGEFAPVLAEFGPLWYFNDKTRNPPSWNEHASISVISDTITNYLPLPASHTPTAYGQHIGMPSWSWLHGYQCWMHASQHHWITVFSDLTHASEWTTHHSIISITTQHPGSTLLLRTQCAAIGTPRPHSGPPACVWLRWIFRISLDPLY